MSVISRPAARSMLSPQARRIMQLADRDVARKVYRCLVPGCHRRAILSHAIPRALLVEAIAEQGHVYSQNMASMTSVIKGRTPSDPIEIERVGVNKATVFKGYCARHDALLFAPVEVPGADMRNSVAHALHLRALSVEYCRNRMVCDFEDRVDELAKTQGFASRIAAPPSPIRRARDNMKATLAYMFEHHRLATREGISYIVLPFKRNLEVSCCGIFGHQFGVVRATIGYNLISYGDMSMLALTTFRSTIGALDAFLGTYGYPANFDIERLLNEVAFTKGEEPAISPRLWQSLTDDQRSQIGESLRPPWVRPTQSAPRIIHLGADDGVAIITPAMWSRFLSGFVAPSRNRLPR